MYEIKDVSKWEQKGHSKGSREKLNVINPFTKKIYMFKYPAQYEDNIYGDIWAEKIATEIGKILKLNVQNTYLAKNEGKNGILIEYSLDMKEEYLEEGAVKLKEIFPEFQKDKSPYYTFENIKFYFEREKIEIAEFIDLIFFDCLIGNTDRHSENWGILKSYNGDSKRLSPAYDNGSSLGRDYHSKQSEISGINMQTYINKANSRIRIVDDKRISLFNFFHEVMKEYPYKKQEYLKKLDILTDEKIKEIIFKVQEEFMSEILKNFVIRILNERKMKMIEILKNLEKEEEYD